MAFSPFTEFCIEICSRLGRVRTRRMFGSVGLYIDDLFVGIITQNTLYLKSSSKHRDAYVQAGGTMFVYTRLGKPRSLDFFTPPESFFDSLQEQRLWLRRAMESALIAANTKRYPSTPKSDVV